MLDEKKIYAASMIELKIQLSEMECQEDVHTVKSNLNLILKKSMANSMYWKKHRANFYHKIQEIGENC